MLTHLVGGRTNMRKLMVFLMVLVLAQLAKATEFGYVTLEVKLGSSVGDVFYAHPEVQNLGLYVYSKEYHEAWEKVDGPTDFNRLKPGMHNFPVTKLIEQEAQAVGVPTSLPAIDTPKTEGVKDEPESNEQEVVVTTRKYEPSGIVQLDFDQYEKVDWSPAPQRTATIPETLTPIVEIQIAAHTEPAQDAELLMRAEKPEAFTVKAEEKIADQNQAAYKRLNKRSYPRESLFVTNLPYLLLGSALIITIILSIISARCLWPRLVKHATRLTAPDTSPRETELETQVNQLEKELATYKKHLFLFNYPGLKRRSDTKLLKDLALQVKGQTPEGMSLVFVPGLDELVPARPLIVEGALRHAQEILGEKCLYILPEQRAWVKKDVEKKQTKKPDLRILRKPAAHAAASR